MSFIDELKKVGKAKQEEAINLERSRTELAKQRDTLAQAWAKTHIEVVKRKAMKAALRGETQALIAKIDTDSKHLVNDLCKGIAGWPSRLEVEQLQGKYKYLFYECLAVGLKPKVIYAWDGGGVSSWYDFWVTW